MWMKSEPNQENSSEKFGKRGGSNLLKCPMCNGRGYFEPTQMPALTNTKSVTVEKHENIENALKLPQLNTKPDGKRWRKPLCKYSLPSINNVKNLPENRSYDRSDSSECHVDYTDGKRFLDGQNNQTQGVANSVLKKAEEGIRNGPPHRLSVVSSAESNIESNLIPSPKTPKNPPETLRICLSKLKSTNWNDAVSSLKEIVQLSRFHPQMLEPSMVIVYRGLISLLKSFRSTVVRTACQAANELFATMANTQRPEFDEVVSNLLQRTADTNKAVRQDANEALDTMVINIPPVHSVRAIMNRGIGHKSPLVRSASARLFVCIVGVVGVESIYDGNKETRGRIMSSGAAFMQDGSQEVRNFGRRLMKMLMKHEDFDEVLQAEVNDVMMKRIEKTLVTMKYKT